MLFPAVRSLGQEEFPLLCRSCPRAPAGDCISQVCEKAAPAPLLVLGCKPIPGAIQSQQGIVSSPGRVPALGPFHLGLSRPFWSSFMPRGPCKCLRSLQTLKNNFYKQNISGGQFPPKTHAVGASAAQAVFAFRLLHKKVKVTLYVYTKPVFVSHPFIGQT